MGVEKLMKESLLQKTMDNITVVMVTFSGFEKANFSNETDEVKKSELDTSYQSLHKSFVSSSGIKYGEKYNNTYSTPLGSKSFVLNNSDRQHSTTKKFDTSASLDLNGLSPLERFQKSYKRNNL